MVADECVLILMLKFDDNNSYNKNVRYSAHDTFLESQSSGILIIKRLESQII